MSIGDVPRLLAELNVSSMKTAQYLHWLIRKGILEEKEQTEILIAGSIIKRLNDDIKASADSKDWECLEYTARLARRWNEELNAWFKQRFEGIDVPPPFIKWELHKMPARFTTMGKEEEIRENPGEGLLELKVHAEHLKAQLNMYWEWAQNYFDETESQYDDYIDEYKDIVSVLSRAEFTLRWGQKDPQYIQRAKELYAEFIKGAEWFIEDLKQYYIYE